MEGNAPKSSTTNIFLFMVLAIALIVGIIMLVQTFLAKAKTPEELAAEKKAAEEAEKKLAEEQKAAGKPDLLGLYGKTRVIQAYVVMKETGNGDVTKSSIYAGGKGIDGVYGTSTTAAVNKVMGRTVDGKNPLTDAELKMILDFLGNSTITKLKVTKIS